MMLAEITCMYKEDRWERPSAYTTEVPWNELPMALRVRGFYQKYEALFLGLPEYREAVLAKPEDLLPVFRAMLQYDFKTDVALVELHKYNTSYITVTLNRYIEKFQQYKKMTSVLDHCPENFTMLVRRI